MKRAFILAVGMAAVAATTIAPAFARSHHHKSRIHHGYGTHTTQHGPETGATGTGGGAGAGGAGGTGASGGAGAGGGAGGAAGGGAGGR